MANSGGVQDLVEQTVSAFLTSLSEKRPQIYVAYSGGLDSAVLLHALSRQSHPFTLTAIHIDHGLHPQSRQWSEHCQQLCRKQGINFQCQRVIVKSGQGDSPEASARKMRYQGLSSCLPSGAYLLTGHHQDDQAETVLLQLMRGAGAKGLSAMPSMSTLGQGFLARPLLAVTRATIRLYAEQQQLQWIEDSSNHNMAYDRNFIRHQVMPLLGQKRPTVGQAIARSAAHCGEMTTLCGELAAIDLNTVQQQGGQTLSRSALTTLSATRQRNLIRYWLQQWCLPLPSTVKLNHIICDVVNSHHGAKPCVRWGGVAMTREKDCIVVRVEPKA